MFNLAYLLERSARHFGDHPAVFHGDQVANYRQLNDRVARLADGLAGLGLAPGDRIAMIVEAEPRALEIMYGALRAGLILVPIGPRLHALEQLFIVKDSGAAAIACSSRHASALVKAGTPESLPLIVFDTFADDVPSAIEFEQLVRDGDATHPLHESAADDLAWLFYTSGTTGKPKGAMLSNRNLLTMVDAQLIEHNSVANDDRYAYLTPLSHGSGLATFLQMARGAAHVFPAAGGFDPQEFYALVARHNVTSCQMVPTQVQMLVESPPSSASRLTSLRTIGYGAAPMYVNRLKEAISIFGPIFTQTYGLGEAPRGITCLPKRDHVVRDADGERRLGSVGRECIHVQVRIVDDAGNILPSGSEGEVVVRGDLVMRGYWNNPSATAEALRNGWLHTGDVGYFDDASYLFLTDRKKDVIITGGSNVYPREVEEVLYRHPAILEACVFGEADPKWGEHIAAAVVRRPGIELDEAMVIDWCKAQLASYKKPARVLFLSSLPKSAVGKVLKREVQRQAMENGEG